MYITTYVTNSCFLYSDNENFDLFSIKVHSKGISVNITLSFGRESVIALLFWINVCHIVCQFGIYGSTVLITCTNHLQINRVFDLHLSFLFYKYCFFAACSYQAFFFLIKNHLFEVSTLRESVYLWPTRWVPLHDRFVTVKGKWWKIQSVWVRVCHMGWSLMKKKTLNVKVMPSRPIVCKA